VPRDLAVLLDENIPPELGPWLAAQRPGWTIRHRGRSDREVFERAQSMGALVLTFDEDFADQRAFPVGAHHGVIRLRIWPTTVEEAQAALLRLLSEVDDDDLVGALVIIGRTHIRVRVGPGSPSEPRE
jgi:predicted nuclease of predicted toxin-antitoxin system